jgi:Protein of unknown function (DUF3074)
MSRLHKALEQLGPRNFSDIPDDDLSHFLQDTFVAAEEIVDSVPRGGDASGNTVKNVATPADKVMSALDLVSLHSQAPPVDPSQQELAKLWGKPLRLGAKENPLGLSFYKMAAHDRHGAWFARRSVHKGLSFNRWKKAIKSEFLESMNVSGGPGAGSIRGIGADKRLERKDVPGVGALEGKFSTDKSAC